jgi:hypothetical protein
VTFQRVSPTDIDVLRQFLTEADLTLAGLDAPTVRLWVQRDGTGAIIGSTGYEASAEGHHALIRSVAVARGHRSAGAGSRLAMHATEPTMPGYSLVDPVQPAERDALARVLSETHQVQLFEQTGQLGREVAWSRPLVDLHR